MKKMYLLIAGSLLAGSVSFAQCTVTFTENVNGLQVDVTVTGTGTATIPTYGVNWGDGSNPSGGAGTTYSHTYTTAGTYNVCGLYGDLQNLNGCNAQDCRDIIVTSSSASIKEIDEPFTVAVFPNPAVSYIEITANETLEDVKIINTLGSIVYTEKVNATSTKININDLPKGVYLIKVNGVTKRFVKK